MAERKLPELLKRDRAFFPFSYDHDKKIFLVGDREVPDENPLELANFRYEDHKARTPKKVIRKSAVIVDTLMHTITTPVLNDWIREQDDLAGQVTPVMQEVFCRLAQGKIPDDILSKFTDDIRGNRYSGMYGFDARVSEYGWLRLQVFGECACMGVAFGDGYNWDEENLKLGYPEISMHNIDTEYQLGAIYAGLGHLATLATKDASVSR